MSDPDAPLGGSRAAADLIDADLVRALVADQFPQWAGWPVRPVARDGVDNRTFRLGEELSARLPAGDWYALQVAKEQRWLPRLAPALPLPIPTPVGRGRPGGGYPYEWSIYRWIEGEPATRQDVAHLGELARDLAGFLLALQAVDATDGPVPGRHNFFRGGPLRTYAQQAVEAIELLGDEIDGAAATLTLDDALAATATGPAVWFHGDVAEGNLLLRDGRLAAVIDFGTCGVGDPACDTVVAWTLLDESSRAVFREALEVDAATWSRGRGWALWKALITLAGSRATDPTAAAEAFRVIDAVLTDDG